MKTILLIMVMVMMGCSGQSQEQSQEQSNEPKANDHRIVKRGSAYIVQSYQSWPDWNDICTGDERTFQQAKDLIELFDSTDVEVIYNIKTNK